MLRPCVTGRLIRQSQVEGPVPQRSIQLSPYMYQRLSPFSCSLLYTVQPRRLSKGTIYKTATNESTPPQIATMIPTLVTRIFQMIFAIIVLALSVRAAKWQLVGAVPTTTAYSAFAGAFAILVTLVGLAALWLSAIPKIIVSGLDGLASILLLAGGIVSLLRIVEVCTLLI